MTAITIHQALTVFAWFVIATILSILLLIARYYQNVSGERTRFWAFGVSIIIFGLATARYAFTGQINGDPLGDILWLIGGLLLTSMCVYLYNLMTAER